MQLQPLVKRKPNRPPPRLPENREPNEEDEKDRGANEPAEEALALAAEAPDAVGAGPSPASLEIAESAVVATTGVDSAPISDVPEPRAETVDDGFGAGLEGSRSPDPPADDAATRRA